MDNLEQNGTGTTPEVSVAELPPVDTANDVQPIVQPLVTEDGDTPAVVPPTSPKATKKNIMIIAVGAVLVVLVLLVMFKDFIPLINGNPTLSIVSPDPLESSFRDEFTVDLMLSDLPDNLYPAASVAITFDKNKLEFTGIKMGNMMTYENYVPGQEGEPAFNIPLWLANPEMANRTGEVKAIYLDMTAEKNAYAPEGFDKKTKNVPIRLGFKLKDSVSAGESFKLEFTDAVFATPNGDKDNTSLSMAEKYRTLNIKNGTIKVKK